jgi:hypothetical protein
MSLSKNSARLASRSAVSPSSSPLDQFPPSYPKLRIAPPNPEVFEGHFVRKHPWEKLARKVNRIASSDESGWPYAANVFYAIGNLPSALVAALSLQGSSEILTAIAALSLAVGAFCTVVHWNLRHRQISSVQGIRECIEEIEQEFTRL